MRRADGTMYKGQFKDGHPVQGVMLTANEEYTGDLNQNWLKHGYGLAKYPHTEGQYRGDFVEGKRSGRGIYTVKEQGVITVIQALWQDDLIQVGKMENKLGSYQGQFNSNFEPQGQGKMLYADCDDIYEGRWQNGKWHGQGIFKCNEYLFDG